MNSNMEGLPRVPEMVEAQRRWARSLSEGVWGFFEHDNSERN